MDLHHTDILKTVQQWLTTLSTVIWLQENLADPWVPPNRAAEMVRFALEHRFPGISRVCKIQLSGEHKNRTVYLRFPVLGFIYLISPFSGINDCVVVRQLTSEGLHGTLEKLNHHACRAQSTPYLENRLNLPGVLLINMTTPFFYHTPSVALGVGMVCSILRRRQKARVWVLDMKLGVTESQCLSLIREQQPEMVGASIDFGEKSAFCHLFNGILKECRGREPLLFAGNYLAYLHSKELLQRFPRLIINRSEGEQFMLDLVDHYHGKIAKDQISAAIFRESETGEIVTTPVREIQMDELAPPAVDTVRTVAQRRGVFPLELSRGCIYNGCAFCPRHHKTKKWKSLSPTRAVEWIETISQIFDLYPDIKRKIYFVDEEFIGDDDSGAGTRWLSDLGEALKEQHLNMAFEFNTSVDQIYNPTKDEDWHIRRWKALRSWKQIGLTRVLLGIESGSNSVLTRFNKQHRVKDSIYALQVLSALGIDIRVTFITYDPLMSMDELWENYVYLGRRDAIYQELGSEEEHLYTLFRCIDDPGLNRILSLNTPLYDKVCYLHNTLKVLADSKYMKMMNAVGLNDDGDAHVKTVTLLEEMEILNPDQVGIQYTDLAIGAASKLSEQWMTKANSLTHLLSLPVKADSLEKRRTRRHLSRKIHEFSYLFLEVLLYLLGGSRISDDQLTVDLKAGCWDSEEYMMGLVQTLKRKLSKGIPIRGEVEQEILEICGAALKEVMTRFNRSHNCTTEGDSHRWQQENWNLVQRWETFAADISDWDIVKPFS